MELDSVIERVHRLLADNLPIRSSKTPSGWTTFNCVMCSDTRKRAGVIVTGPKISYHCFNCHYVTGWSPSPHISTKYRDLALKLGATQEQIHQTQVELLKHSEDLEDQEIEGYVYSLQKFEIVDLPPDVIVVGDLPDDHEVKQYAIARGLLGLYPLLYFANDILYNI